MNEAKEIIEEAKENIKNIFNVNLKTFCKETKKKILLDVYSELYNENNFQNVVIENEW